ncbi:hypothetical protein ID866_12345 [Astraeus odoratus]|nr:hypothetical protein ID866_12345 [Astraeus odoratus]
MKLPCRMADRVLIVIDALDESGEEPSREHILRILSSQKIKKLPPNFRILVTSRPLSDISDSLLGAMHIQVKFMDEIPSAATDRDIRIYINDQLSDTVSMLEGEEITKFLPQAKKGS